MEDVRCDFGTGYMAATASPDSENMAQVITTTLC